MSTERKISASLIPDGSVQVVPGQAGAPADQEAPAERTGGAQCRLHQPLQEPAGGSDPARPRGQQGGRGARGPAEGQHGPSSSQHLGGGGGGAGRG